MYPDLFERCIEIVLRNEGGYGNHPADPGGETNFGIADAADGKKDGMIDIDHNGTGDVIVKNLTIDQAKAIYYKKYWLPMKLDYLNNSDLVLQVFDFGVNAGPATSIKMLQRISGAIVDGKGGPQTARMVNNFNGDIVAEFIKGRRQFYLDLIKKNHNLQVFIAGWLNRIEHTKFN